ncbi:MAG: hypothetical protein KY455_10725 [Euryarchaeota archaeon]|nr:hypothetical protein [Euryarchaeota archaeon]
MAHTTIPIDPRIRDRLRTFGIAGETYNEILERLMDESAERAFTAELYRIYKETPEDAWVDLEDL